jgi:pimeloyl-ACP methyl ester carboxylesterase
MQSLELNIDVSDRVGLERATVAVAVTLPDPGRLPPRPVVCFAKPGAGYAKAYFTHSLPGPGKGAQASWHAANGWIFVASDCLGSGDSRDVVPATGSFRRLASDARIANSEAVIAAEESGANLVAASSMRWYFHYDDVDSSVDDISDFPRRHGNPPPWASVSVPNPTAAWCVTPGAVAPEAAAITVPVLVALGERDVSADPRGEGRAYQSCSSIDLFICPRMGHMHNFAGTRELLWRRVETWGNWVSAANYAILDTSRPTSASARSTTVRRNSANRSSPIIAAIRSSAILISRCAACSSNRPDGVSRTILARLSVDSASRVRYPMSSSSRNRSLTDCLVICRRSAS